MKETYCRLHSVGITIAIMELRLRSIRVAPRPLIGVRALAQENHAGANPHRPPALARSSRNASFASNSS